MFTQLFPIAIDLPGVRSLRRRRDDELAIGEQESIWWSALRVFLLAQVVLGHLAAIAMPTIPQLPDYATAHNAFVLAYRLLTRFGPQSAFLFVFVSGYCVGGPLLARSLDRRAPDLRDFLLRRAGRLAPTLLLGICLGAVVDILAVNLLDAGAAYSRLGPYDFVATMTATNLLGSLLCLQPTFTQAFGSNGPLWTLGDIVQFYAAGFWLCQGIARHHVLRLAAAALLIGLGLTLASEWALLFACWLLGAFARVYALPARLSRGGMVVAALAFLAANRLPGAISILACGLAGLAFAAWLHDRRPAFPKALVAAARRGGAISYSAYVVHYPVAFALFATLFAQRTASLTAALSFLTLALVAIALAALAVEYGARRLLQLRH